MAIGATAVLASSSGWLAAWPLLVGIAARRPASWVAAMMACAAAWAAGPLESMAVVAMATLAATGDLSVNSMTRSYAGWLAARIVWPLAGVAIGSAVAPSVMVGAWLALLLTVGSLWAASRAGASTVIGLTSADTVSLAMVTAAAAVLVGGMAESWPLAAASWGVLMPAGPWLVRWLHQAADDPLPRGTSDMVAGLLSRTPIRRCLGRVAMVTMLMAMVGWLLLDPARAGWAAMVAGAWMFSLAGPAATLDDGALGGAGSPWEAVWRSTPEQRPGRSLLGPGISLSVETVIRHAAILGWPSLVAAAVAVGAPTGPWPALLVAGVVAAAAGFMVAAVVGCRGLALSGDTALATVLALAAAAVLLLPMAVPSDIAAFRPDLRDFER